MTSESSVVLVTALQLCCETIFIGHSRGMLSGVAEHGHGQPTRNWGWQSALSLPHPKKSRVEVEAASTGISAPAFTL